MESPLTCRITMRTDSLVSASSGTTEKTKEWKAVNEEKRNRTDDDQAETGGEAGHGKKYMLKTTRDVDCPASEDRHVASHRHDTERNSSFLHNHSTPDDLLLSKKRPLIALL